MSEWAIRIILQYVTMYTVCADPQSVRRLPQTDRRADRSSLCHNLFSDAQALFARSHHSHLSLKLLKQEKKVSSAGMLGLVWLGSISGGVECRFFH